MFKLTASALVAVIALSPSAFADDVQKVTLTHSYDAALLSTDEGASQILSEIERAAARACTSRLPAYGSYYTDDACAESLVVSAVRQIRANESNAGAVVAPSFQRTAVTTLASAD